MTDELWQHATDAAGDTTVVAFLGATGDGRLVLSISDADAIELGVTLGGQAAGRLWVALGDWLGHG